MSIQEKIADAFNRGYGVVCVMPHKEYHHNRNLSQSQRRKAGRVEIWLEGEELEKKLRDIQLRKIEAEKREEFIRQNHVSKKEFAKLLNKEFRKRGHTAKIDHESVSGSVYTVVSGIGRIRISDHEILSRDPMKAYVGNYQAEIIDEVFLQTEVEEVIKHIMEQVEEIS